MWVSRKTLFSAVRATTQWKQISLRSSHGYLGRGPVVEAGGGYLGRGPVVEAGAGGGGLGGGPVAEGRYRRPEWRPVVEA